MWKRHKGKIIAGVILLAVAGFVGSGIYKKKNQATEVSVAKVKVQDVVGKVTANGKIQAENKVDLSALVMGQIVNLAVREGDKVKEGDFLLQIDKNRAAAEEAGLRRGAPGEPRRPRLGQGGDGPGGEAISTARSRTTKRGSSPRRTTSGPSRAYETAPGRLPSRREQRIDAEPRRPSTPAATRVRRSTVRAPIDGIVTTLRVKAGEVTVIGTMNNPGTQLMTISDMSTVEAVLMVDETDMPTIAVGQKAMLTIDSYPGTEVRRGRDRGGALADPAGTTPTSRGSPPRPRRSTSR